MRRSYYTGITEGMPTSTAGKVWKFIIAAVLIGAVIFAIKNGIDLIGYITNSPWYVLLGGGIAVWLYIRGEIMWGDD